MDHDKPISNMEKMRLKKRLERAQAEALDVLTGEELETVDDVLDELKDYGDAALVTEDQEVILQGVMRKLDTEGL